MLMAASLELMAVMEDYAFLRAGAGACCLALHGRLRCSDAGHILFSHA